MEDPVPLVAVLASLIPAIPSMVLDGVLIALGTSRWSRHPRTSLFAVSAGVLLVVLDTVGRATMAWLPMRMGAEGRDLAHTGVALSILAVASGVLHAVAMGLLVAAVFVERGPQRPT